MTPIRSIEEALINGDSVNDEDLDRIHVHFEQLYKLLNELGPKWTWPRNEARARFEDTLYYINNRKKAERRNGEF